MNHSKLVAIVLFGAAVAMTAPGGARANQLAGPLVSGSVTSIQGDSITIDGQTYAVAPGTPAAQELSSISPGERVDAVLSGPKSSSGSQVINVVVHKGH